MDIKKEIKKLLIEKNMTMSQLIQLLNKKTGQKDSLQNLSGKLNRDTLKFREAEEILTVLNYEFIIVSKEKIS